MLNEFCKNMDYSLDIPLKVEKTERDDNDNLRLLFDVDIKMEQETNGESDWCISNLENELLAPLFFKHVVEAQGTQCELCCRYFPDRNTILRHNLSHLQVTIVNPVTFQCNYCTSFFTNKQSFKRHISAHNCSKTSTLTYKPKSYRAGQDVLKQTEHSKCKNKLRDGMTNLLPYKPTACTLTQQCKSKKTHYCNICCKAYTYQNWHAHMKDVHSVGKFSCGICGMVFKCERYLKKHLSNVHIGKVSVKTSVKCDQCDTVLQSLYALTTHKRTVHSDTKHVCYICKSTLKCKSYLLTHMRRLHYSDGKKHECECGKSFKSHRYLMVHKRNSHLKKKGKINIKTEDMLE